MQHIRNHANPVQDCNFVLYDGSYTSSNGLASAQNAIFATQTSGQGTSPCRLLVSSANGGSISIVDATGRTVYLNPSAVVLPPVDSLAAGQTLAQGDRLYSDDGSYFLTVQSDGNLVLCASCTFQGPCTHDGVWHTCHQRCLIATPCLEQVQYCPLQWLLYLFEVWCVLCQHVRAFHQDTLQRCDGDGAPCPSLVYNLLELLLRGKV